MPGKLPLEIHEASPVNEKSSSHALLVSHDLSQSGAPILLLQIARILLADGWGVSLLSLQPGELATSFVEIGVPVIAFTTAGTPLKEDLATIASGADILICNTVATKCVVEALGISKPVLWYLHEVSLLQATIVAERGFTRTLQRPQVVWAGSELSASLVRPCRADVEVVPYGLEPIRPETLRGFNVTSPARLAVFGSYESRKGQDLLVASLDHLPPDEQAMIRIEMYGRVIDKEFFARLTTAAKQIPQVSINGELDAKRYEDAMLATEAVVVPSRDDTLPLVSLDALGARRILMCTATTGTSAFIETGKSGYIAGEASSEALAAMLSQALRDRTNWEGVAEAGHDVFQSFFSTPAFSERLLSTCRNMLLGKESREIV